MGREGSREIFWVKQKHKTNVLNYVKNRIERYITELLKYLELMIAYIKKIIKESINNSRNILKL